MPALNQRKCRRASSGGSASAFPNNKAPAVIKTVRGKAEMSGRNLPAFLVPTASRSAAASNLSFGVACVQDAALAARRQMILNDTFRARSPCDAAAATRHPRIIRGDAAVLGLRRARRCATSVDKRGRRGHAMRHCFVGDDGVVRGESGSRGSRGNAEIAEDMENTVDTLSKCICKTNSSFELQGDINFRPYPYYCK